MLSQLQLQLLLCEVAADHRVTVLINAVGEVLAGFQEKSEPALRTHHDADSPHTPIPLPGS